MKHPAPPVQTEITLTNCDREPIHFPGAIQPHGLLVVLSESSWTVIQASNNSATLTGIPPRGLLGQPVERLLGDEPARALRAWCREEALDTAILYPGKLLLKPAGENTPVSCNALLHRTGGGLVLELEPHQPTEAPDAAAAGLQAAVERLHEAEDIQDLCRIAAEEFRKISGLDRIMIYRFDLDWHGSVIAEARADHMTSYLGQHFPASDIPVQARRLYLENRLRLIADVDYEPAALVPVDNPDTGEPLDMSQSTLRSVSPIHIQYLQNMGVQASMSVSILRNNALWGLVACHHATPHYLSATTRTACMILGQVVGVILEARQEIEDKRQIERFNEVRDHLLKYMIREPNFIDGLVMFEPNLLDQTDARGAAILWGEECIRLGQVPGQTEILRLASWLDDRMEHRFYATSALPYEHREARAFQEVASGLIAVSLSRIKRFYLFWFRPEEAQTVYWAGNPNKAVSEESEEQPSPRTSFQKWKDMQRGKARPWTAQELEAAQQLSREIVDIVFVKVDQVERLNISLVEANERLTSSQNNLRRLAIRLQNIREAERKDLSRTVHDVLGQALTGLRMDLAMIEKKVPAEQTDQHKRIKAMQDAIDETIGVARRIAHDLRPGILDDLGVTPALEWETERFEERSGIASTFVDDTDGLELDPNRSTTIFRVFQELLTNVARHSGATELSVTVRRQEDNFVLNVQDNGRGIGSEQIAGTQSLGLLGMRERLAPWNGHIDFDGIPGEGTLVTVVVPLSGPENTRHRP